MALQVVAVAADAHRFHQSVDEHLALVDFHSGSQDDPSLSKASESSHPAADGCQHCCHCHGSFHALIGNDKPELPAVSSEVFSSIPTQFASQPASSLYRPPKG
jgi:hypothetical protein